WEQYPAQCVWRAPKNTDLALLRILNGNPVPEHEVVFAALSCDTRDLEAVGYPLAKRDEQDNAREYRVSGHLQIESSASSFAFTVQMADTPSDITQWQGMSGAVVVKHHPSTRQMQVFGVVEEVSPRFTYGKLYVTGIAAAFDNPEFQQLLQSALGRPPELVAIPADPLLEIPRGVSEERIYSAFRSP